MGKSSQLKNVFSRSLIGSRVKHNHANNHMTMKHMNMSSVSSMMYDAVNRYSISGQQQRIALAQRLFNAAQHQAFQPDWYADSPFHRSSGNRSSNSSTTSSNDESSPSSSSSRRLGLTSDFRSHHAMLSMHIWFLHRRLLASSEIEKKSNQGKASFHLLVQEELFDIFWNDTQVRIRAAGINELMVNKHLKDAQQQTFLQITQYDHAHETYPMFQGKDNDEKRFEIVCDSVWRHLLGGGTKNEASEGGDTDSDSDSNPNSNNDDIPDELIRRMGAYVEFQLENVLYRLPDDYFEEGRIAWGNIPQLEVPVPEEDYATQTSQEEENKDDLALTGRDFLLKNDYHGNDEDGVENRRSDWVRVLNNAGEPYYWNMVTNQTSWSCKDDE